MINRDIAAVEANITTLAMLQSTTQDTIDISLLGKLFELMAEHQKTMNLLVEILVEKSDPADTETDADLKEKKHSSVISCLPESTRQKVIDRHHDDKQRIEEMMEELEVNAVPVTTYRLPSNPNNTTDLLRLVKVVLSMSTQQRQVLSNVKKLQNSSRYKGVYVLSSLKKAERELNYKLQQTALMAQLVKR
uniref:Uncharacterized protein n=1 Tax=Acrobeloides nanus TaxID=290746 RepID=A0A914DJD8_9BILA